MSIRQVVLDVETTGFSPHRGDRIIEIAIVELKNYQPTRKEFQQCFNPAKKLSSRITQITGIRDRDLVGQPKFGDPKVVRELVDFIGHSTIIAHCAGFDRGFLNAELRRVGEKEFHQQQWIDTLALARKKLKLKGDRPDSFTLESLCQYFDIPLEGCEKYHRALADCHQTAKLYSELMKLD